jgi:hypothetical protein
MLVGVMWFVIIVYSSIALPFLQKYPAGFPRANSYFCQTAHVPQIQDCEGSRSLQVATPLEQYTPGKFSGFGTLPFPRRLISSLELFNFLLTHSLAACTGHSGHIHLPMFSTVYGTFELLFTFTHPLIPYL